MYKIISGSASENLSAKIAELLNMQLTERSIARFSDMETRIRIHESVRGNEIFLIQSTSSPANENIMELLLMLDSLKRASASSISVILPYFGYARQDRKSEPRVPISAKLVADLITTAGADRVITMNLHAGQIQGFFNIPMDNLYASPVQLAYLKQSGLFGEEMVVVSPDSGGVSRARAYAKRLGASLAIVDKRRPNPNESKVMNVIGDIEGKTAVIVDDIIDTAGTLVGAAEMLLQKGAKGVFALATHGVLSGPAIERIENSGISQVIITDTIDNSERLQGHPKLKVISVASIFAEVIRVITTNESVATLFDVSE